MSEVNRTIDLYCYNKWCKFNDVDTNSCHSAVPIELDMIDENDEMRCLTFEDREE
jgi:hypothetical protein